MSRSYILGAILAWFSLASLAVGGFAAFSTDTTEPAITQGAQAGQLAGVAKGGEIEAPDVMAFSPPVEAWRPLVERYFEKRDTNQALAVLYCESSGNPSATHTHSRAAGLFQHLPQFWEERSQAAQLPGAGIFDAESNIAVAAWLVYEGGGWKHWYPSSSCWTTMANDP